MSNARPDTLVTGANLNEVVQRWRLTFCPQRCLCLNDFPGSMLRGAFGHALRLLECDCGSDTHQPTCLYFRLFEGAAGATPAYVISCAGLPNTLVAGQRCEFIFTVLGEVNAEPDWQERLKMVWELVMRRGLGNPRTPCQLLAIRPDSLAVQPLSKSVELSLTSPWAIKRQGQPLKAADIRLADILIALAQRQRLLGRHLQLPLCVPDNDQLLDWDSQIQVTLDLSDAVWGRRSQRQGRKHILAGVQGWVSLQTLPQEAELELGSLLNHGVWLHAGAKTAFGLGGLALRHRPRLEGLNGFAGIKRRIEQ